MSDITLEIRGKNLHVVSPYHPAFVAEARNLSGKWERPYWTFDARDEGRVRAALVRVYGTDGADVPVTDVELIVTRDTDNPLFAYGRMVVERRGRDTRVTLGEGVIVVAGGFPASAGSRNNPALFKFNDDGSATLLIRDVPISLLEDKP